jgi:hypothetical protein
MFHIDNSPSSREGLCGSREELVKIWVWQHYAGAIGAIGSHSWPGDSVTVTMSLTVREAAAQVQVVVKV